MHGCITLAIASHVGIAGGSSVNAILFATVALSLEIQAKDERIGEEDKHVFMS